MELKTRFDYTIEIGGYTFELDLYKSFDNNSYAVYYKEQWLGNVEYRDERLWQAELVRDSRTIHKAPTHFKFMEEGIQWIMEMYGSSYLLEQQKLKQEQEVNQMTRKLSYEEIEKKCGKALTDFLFEKGEYYNANDQQEAYKLISEELEKEYSRASRKLEAYKNLVEELVDKLTNAEAEIERTKGLVDLAERYKTSSEFHFWEDQEDQESGWPETVVIPPEESTGDTNAPNTLTSQEIQDAKNKLGVVGGESTSETANADVKQSLTDKEYRNQHPYNIQRILNDKNHVVYEVFREIDGERKSIWEYQEYDDAVAAMDELNKMWSQIIYSPDGSYKQPDVPVENEEDLAGEYVAYDPFNGQRHVFPTKEARDNWLRYTAVDANGEGHIFPSKEMLDKWLEENPNPAPENDKSIKKYLADQEAAFQEEYRKSLATYRKNHEAALKKNVPDKEAPDALPDTLVTEEDYNNIARRYRGLKPEYTATDVNGEKQVFPTAAKRDKRVRDKIKTNVSSEALALQSQGFGQSEEPERPDTCTCNEERGPFYPYDHP